MLTHANIWANVVQTESWTNPAYILGGHERYLVVIPYFHIYAFSVCMMVGLRVGALQIIHPKYEPDAVLASIRDFRPTYFPAVPTVFVSLLNHPKVGEYGLDRVRLFNSGGAPCPVEVLEEFERRIGRPLGEGYGLSETSPVTHSTPQLAMRKMGTIGLPFPTSKGADEDPDRLAESRAALAQLGDVLDAAERMLAAFGPALADRTDVVWLDQPLSPESNRPPPPCGWPRCPWAACWPGGCSGSGRSR